MSSSVLDALTFPLRGSQLVEASAGTGKTYTIGALYLRLVLGHGGDAGFVRPLDPPEILVVTFTEAATKELRDRIRQRLSEAALAFLADPAEVAPLPRGQDLLHDLRSDYPPSRWPACARRLQLAAEWMDEAAISTIHGWCNRMLREHAFDSGSLFTQALQADAQELHDEAVRDYWRTFVYPLPAELALQLAGWWPTPTDLGKALRSLLPHAATIARGEAPQQALGTAQDEAATLLAQWKRPWIAWSGELLSALDAAVTAKQLKAANLKTRKSWCEAMSAWAQGDAHRPELTDKAWTRLTRAGMDEIATGDFRLRHPALEDFETLAQRLQSLPDGRQAVLCHAARWVLQRVTAEKARRAEIGFDDMLAQLDAALQGEGGARLARTMRAQFPVALIDEFQDTDPLQYRIFDSVYGIAANPQDHAIVLIGDPKQAIYSFRGADIHTYLRARRDTGDRHATLGTNFRATAGMVDAVNHLFATAEVRGAPGAFRFGGGNAGENPLPFLPVRAHGREDRWVIEGDAAPALTCWWSEAQAGYREAMAAACAAEVVRLLLLGQQGRAGFARDGALTPVRPGDIAVLVNTGTDAQAVRRALQQAGVRSVYLSDSDSVFHTAAAPDVQWLLQACAAPEDDRLLRAALATPLLGRSWQALEHLNLDEAAWEAEVLRFRGYREQWRSQGVLPMLRRVLHDFEVPQRLLAAGDERLLTDVLHLAELLQQASPLLDGEHALVRWLAEQRAEDGVQGNESRIVRLESDADLLKVVTVHKSKGLEYPLVFVPFPCYSRPVKATEPPVKWHDAEGTLQLGMDPSAEDVAAADEERLAEDVRKLYVALTRARYATWLGIAPVKQVERCAIGALLAGDAPASLQQRVATLAEQCGSIAVDALPMPTEARYRPHDVTPPLAPEPALPAPRPPWWVASYSALRREEEMPREPVAAVPESAEESNYLESADEAAAPAGRDGIHALPRGAAAGSFLHALLEWAGQEGFAELAARPEAVQREMALRCQGRGWEAWAGVLAAWMTDWLRTPLRLSQCGQELADIAPSGLGAYLVEMEFWFSTAAVDARAIDALVQRHVLPGEPRPALQREHLQGMFKGFIDLVFEHGGRYWVLDYKSNALGATDAAYSAQAQQAEVLRHRYDLQYALYLFALHRHLGARLGERYDYDRDVGGALYLFLRGQGGPAGGLHHERPPRALMDGLDRLFRGEEAA